jgi:Flp pilus assembly protein TadG
MIEGALCFSAFLMLTFGVMEFALTIYAYDFCAYAAQDAARWASARGANYPAPVSASDVRNYVVNQAIGLPSVTVATTWTPNNSPGSTVGVTVSYNVVPLTGLALHSKLQLSSSAVMAITN